MAASAASLPSANRGSTSRANSSMLSQMCSCLFFPACMTNITWSTPAALYRAIRSVTCAGVPIAPRSEPRPACSRRIASGAAFADTISRAKPCSARFSPKLCHRSVPPTRCVPP